MIEYTEDGKAYVRVTAEMRAKMQPTDHLFIVNGADTVPPPDCEHDIAIADGFPNRIKYCKNCVWWDWA